MSDTPRTKGLTGTFYLRCDDCPQPDKCEPHKSVHPDDCADLEREIATLRAALAELQVENAAIRELMAVYNLGGWTDALGPMQRALKAEAKNKQLRAAAERWQTVCDLMTYESCGPVLGWTLGELLPGDDPESAVDAARALATKEPQS